MPIKGFVGFWGHDKNKALPQSLCNIYESSIVNGVSVRGGSYILIASNDYLHEINEEFFIMESSSVNISVLESLRISISLAHGGLSIERDRWGTRPVNYCCTEEGIYFSSDIRYLLIAPIAGIMEYDPIAITESATLGYIYSEERTLFKRIKQLPRNSELKYRANRLQIVRKSLSCDKDRFKDLDEAVASFREIFEFVVSEAWRIVGTKAWLLSGGMDSTALVIAASKCSERLRTIAFASENNKEDVHYSQAIAKMVGSNHVVIQFDEQNALTEFPSFLRDIENIELDGIFSPLGGYAYYLLCKEVSKLGCDVIFPGEGADELLGGYYWPLTHPFGFVDGLKEKTATTDVCNEVVKLFPDVEYRDLYREIIYYLFQGSALTNYHLSCIEHSAKACGLCSYPLYMTNPVDEIVRDVPLHWLCDGVITKILLRGYLSPHLEKVGLSELMTRKKMAMPSVLPCSFTGHLNFIAERAAVHSQNPYRNILRNKPLNIFILDVFHKYYTLRPLEKIDNLEWQEDLQKVLKYECIVHW